MSEYYRTCVVTKKSRLISLVKELRQVEPTFTVTKLGVKDGEFDRLMDILY